MNTSIKIKTSLVDGSGIDDEISVQELIYRLLGDDVKPPLTNCRIEFNDGSQEVSIGLSKNSDNFSISVGENVLEEFTIQSTSKYTAECNEIPIRKTKNTRLVFKPLLIDNLKNKNAVIKGSFFFQKKGIKDDWIDLKDLSLSNLKSGEYVKLELKSDELLNFVKEIVSLYKFHIKEGIQFGETKYIKAHGSLNELSQINEGELKTFFELNKKAGVNVFSKLINYAITIDDSNQLVERLEKLEVDSLQKLNSIVGLSNLKKIYESWLNQSDNADEDYWQKHFAENSFLLSQIFAFPIIILKGKAYVGGKSFDNKGANLLDFLCQNSLTKNTVLIEIKTPMTKLLGSKYRDNIYNVSSDVSGAIIQVSNYKYSLSKDFYSLRSEKLQDMETFNPQSLVIVGNIERELIENDQKKSFELFRNELKNVQIISYDELFSKVKILIDLLEGNDIEHL
ncbi:MAG: DUF4263 domain-containing protein [Ignavibacteriales bacterium]|nr:MAG: DUF4263 domain-containing protein [Ignavibacteriales bacterium]